MPIERGSYVFGPETGTLTVRTKKGGAAAKAGHDLEIEVKSWSAKLDLTDAPGASLTADSPSFEVIAASGGAAPFGAQEKAAVPKPGNDEVLKGTPIEFHASKVDMD